jgi:hypothetical protein
LNCKKAGFAGISKRRRGSVSDQFNDASTMRLDHAPER